MAVCAGENRDGAPCRSSALTGERWCYNHHPDYAEERRRSASHAATAKHSSVGRELGEIRGLVRDLLGVLLADEPPARVRKELTNVVQLLQTYARLAELEVRVGEEPLEGDLGTLGGSRRRCWSASRRWRSASAGSCWPGWRR